MKKKPYNSYQITDAKLDIMRECTNIKEKYLNVQVRELFDAALNLNAYHPLQQQLDNIKTEAKKLSDANPDKQCVTALSNHAITIADRIIERNLNRGA